MLQKILFIALIALLTITAEVAAQPGSCSDQVPSLTEDTTEVSSSGILNSDFRPWRAFDDDIDTRWISQAFAVPAWIAYDFEVDVRIDAYQILNNAGQILTTRAPRDFTFEGKAGDDWIVLDTRTSQTNWISGTPRFFYVASPGLYSEYRLHITNDNDNQAEIVVISISELQFLDCGVLFRDGFESGDTTAWTVQVP